MIAARIRERAREAPEHVAIEAGERSISYGALDARASAIAAALRLRGAGRDVVVAIRSDDRVAIACAMVGVLYAGAAFLVVTSDLPDARVEQMLVDAGVRIVLRDADICIDAGLARADRALDAPESRAEDLAYVVFTSGTTGQPKGVLVTHAGLLPMLDAQIETFALDASARAAWLLSPLFDASISDVFTALASGATLVVRDGLGSLPPRELFAWLARERITHVDLPPSLLALLEGAPPASLRTIVVGGEACREHVVLRLAPLVRLVNVYGPTEATVCTSMNVCRPGELHHARLGMPLPHVVYLVEEDELLIGGPCLARGYAGDPELDAKRFVVRDGERFYRTGDRVRARDASGELEIVGRIDRQVKVAGIRIEPEEIEARLREDPRVLDVAVVLEQRSLTAFIVTRGDASEIREALASRAPKWLVPPRFVVKDALPRTATGKVDYGALTLSEDEAARAEDETTRVICEALASALGRGRIGPDEDFVRAGGDSFAALAACAAADERGVLLSPETITEARTARRIAESREVRGMSVDELDADVAALARPDARPRMTAPRTIFLTGATGTLGPVLVRALARRGLAITCLVRARDDAAADARLRAVLGEMPRGVRALFGDVTLARFGWSAERFAAIAEEHDAVVHAAADLRLTATYTALRSANVLGALHALDFAQRGRARLHHLSTLSVFASSDLARSDRAFSEADDLREARVLHGGYAQTKWAAERILTESVHVTRLGLLLPSRSRDLFGAFVRACAIAGCAPDDPALAFDVTPLDFAAEAIAWLVAISDPQRIRHVANRAPATLADLAQALRVPRVPLVEFRARIAKNRARIDALALASVRALGGSAPMRAFDLFEATRVSLGAAGTLDSLERAGIRCARASDVLAEIVRKALEERA